jgi:hypothetical protein
MKAKLVFNLEAAHQGQGVPDRCRQQGEWPDGAKLGARMYASHIVMHASHMGDKYVCMHVRERL